MINNKYQVEILNNNSHSLFTLEHTFRYVIQINNYTKENITSLYFRRKDIDIESNYIIPNKHNPNYEFIDIIISVVNNENKIINQTLIKVSYEDIKRYPVYIKELNMILHLDSQYHLLDNLIRSLNGLNQFIESFEDEDSTCQVAIFGNDPKGGLNKIYTIFNGFITPIKIENEPTEDKYITILIKEAIDNQIKTFEYNLTEQDFINLKECKGITINCNNRLLFLGTTIKDTKEEYEKYLQNLHEIEYSRLTLDKESEIKKLEQIIKNKETELETIKAELQSIKNIHEKEQIELKSKISELEIENRAINHQLQNYKKLSELNLENKKQTMEEIKVDAEIQKTQTTKEMLETNKEIHEIKKEKEQITKEKDIEKKQKESEIEDKKMAREELSFTKEMIKFVPVAITGAIAVYSIYKSSSINEKDLSHLVKNTLNDSFKSFLISNNNDITSNTIFNEFKKLNESNNQSNDNSMFNKAITQSKKLLNCISKF